MGIGRRHPWRKLAAELDACGAVLVRSNGHLIFRLPNNQMISVSKTPSDSRSGERNALQTLRRALAVTL